ncbi:MAG TPA: LemA family protein [bacterium]|nr:LemA family protein [bacterium]HQH80258.1 LemA family protein [bacterium]
MKRSVFWVLAIAVVALVITCVSKHNELSALDEGLEKQWTPLVNVITPIYMQIPDLVNEVILYNGKEDEVVHNLATAYKDFNESSSTSSQVTAANRIEAALSVLFIEASRRYPGIASHYQFQNLKQIFQTTSEDIDRLVEGYNNSVDNFNSYVRQFPNNIVGMLLGFGSRADYFRKEN